MKQKRIEMRKNKNAFLIIVALLAGSVSCSEKKKEIVTSQNPIRIALYYDSMRFEINTPDLISMKRRAINNDGLIKYEMIYMLNEDTIVFDIFPETEKPQYAIKFLNELYYFDYESMVQHYWTLYFEKELPDRHTLDSLKEENGLKMLYCYNEEKLLCILKENDKISKFAFHRYSNLQAQLNMVKSYRLLKASDFANE